MHALGRIATAPDLPRLAELRSRVTVTAVRGKLDRVIAVRAAACKGPGGAA